MTTGEIENRVSYGFDAGDALAQQRFFFMLGPLKQYLDQPRTTNINVTQDGLIFVERFGESKFEAPERMSETARRALLSFLANCQGKTIDHLQASLSVRMPLYGSRVRGFADPIGGWALVIRQHGPTIPLSEYVERQLISQRLADYLCDAIVSEKNIVVAGAMNSGKTAFVRSLLLEAARIRPEARPIIVQSDDEIRADGFRDKLFLFARVQQATAGLNGTTSRYVYEFTHALEDALQSNGNFLIWGELRDGKSAVGLALALNTGTRGFMTTIHSESAEETIHRIEDLLAFEGKPIVRRMLAKFVDVVVYMKHDTKDGRRWVSDVVTVTGISREGEYVMERLG